MLSRRGFKVGWSVPCQTLLARLHLPWIVTLMHVRLAMDVRNYIPSCLRSSHKLRCGVDLGDARMTGGGGRFAAFCIVGPEAAEDATLVLGGQAEFRGLNV